MDTTASLNCHLRQITAAASRLSYLRGAGRRQAMRDLASNCKGIFGVAQSAALSSKSL